MKGYFFLATLLLSSLAGGAIPAQEIPALIADLNAAREKVDAELTSGYAVGKLRRQFESEAGTDIVESDIQVFYDAPKYRVHVVNSRHQWLPAGSKLSTYSIHAAEHAAGQAAADHIVIFDGEFVYEIEYSPSNAEVTSDAVDKSRTADTAQSADSQPVDRAIERERATDAPSSARGSVYFDFKQGAVLRNAGYPFNPPLHLWKEAIKLEQITEQKIDNDRLDLQVLASGGMVLSLNQASYRTRYYLFDGFEFDFRRVILTLPDVPKPFRETTIYWEQADEVHYVRRLATKDRQVSANPKIDKFDTRSFEIEFSTVDVNSQIDPQAFSLSGLELEPGTPFDDHRSNVNGKPTQLSWSGEQLVQPKQ